MKKNKKIKPIVLFHVSHCYYCYDYFFLLYLLPVFMVHFFVSMKGGYGSWHCSLIIFQQGHPRT